MTKKYEVIEEYKILDKSSEVVIDLSKSKSVKEIINKLNSGSGFNGFTPNFFGVKYNNKDGSK